ncbi:hypothetical protein HWC35_gp146 [Vibrio phage USC-1]|uniref:Uncharacterized protein n=2 Tax=Aphroditevirus USC1 TaxID=2846605 RepID=A0A514A2N0_9CAUD|nr:hypothetical protein HWC35_gp146 [Vibrio phage USC-1]QCW23189.1 hypothetical protein [Vibrio phage 5 TSL-2019]QDH47540.1 hypothetical protein [Vibrio phage USC-1]
MNTKLINLGLKGLFQHALHSIPTIIKNDYSKAMTHELYAVKMPDGVWVSLSFYWKEGDTITITTKGMTHIKQRDFTFDYNPKYGHDFEKLIPYPWNKRVSGAIMRNFLKAAETYNFDTRLTKNTEEKYIRYSMPCELTPSLSFEPNPILIYQPHELLVSVREKLYLLLAKVALGDLEKYVEHEIATQAHLSELGKPLLDFPHIQGDRLQMGLKQYGNPTLRFVIPLPSGDELTYLVPASREDRVEWYKHITEIVYEELGSFDHAPVCRVLKEHYHNTNNDLLTFKPTPHGNVWVMTVDQSLIPWGSIHTREISFMVI